MWARQTIVVGLCVLAAVLAIVSIVVNDSKQKHVHWRKPLCDYISPQGMVVTGEPAQNIYYPGGTSKSLHAAFEDPKNPWGVSPGGARARA